MIYSVNGNYLDMCAKGLASTNRSILTFNDSKTMNNEQPDEVNKNFNQLPQQIPVNTVAKIAENAANKESTDSQTDNIASLISLIESSHKIEANLATMPQILASLPESQGQLILMSAAPSNNAKDGLVTELVQNFSKIDTNEDKLVSYNEVLAYLNRY